MVSHHMMGGDAIVSESIEIIISQYERLTDKEKQHIISVLSTHLGKPIQISTSGLSMYSKDEIKIISNTLNGLILTKENIPDILDSYVRLKGTDLPQKISFGHLKDSESKMLEDNFMIKISVLLLLIFGAIGTIIGILPFIFAYPFSDGPNSSPSNKWELILMISYEGKGSYLILGIALLLISIFSLFKQRKVYYLV